MEHFAGYGFNKSHSTAYAFLAYQTAYLKANYPWHFAAALLTIESQNTDKLALYLAECRERGIPVLPPDINESQLRVHRASPSGRAVRPDGHQERRRGRDRVAARACAKAQGRIRSLDALCEELDLRLANKRVFESLVKAGAFDSLVAGAPALAALPPRELRPRLMAAVDAACEHGARAPARSTRRTGAALRRARAGRRGRGSRADRASRCGAVDRKRAARVREGDARPLLERPPGRPLRGGPRSRSARRPPPSWPRLPTSGSRGDSWGPGGPKPIEPDVSIGGIVAACRQLKTRKGDRMAVFTLEDAHGGVEVIAFPETYQRSAALIETGTHGARARQARARRGDGADPGLRDRAHRERARADRAGGGDPPEGRGQPRTRSRRSARSSRAIAATAACRSRSRWGPTAIRCACARTSRRRSACGRRWRSSPRSSRSWARARWSSGNAPRRSSSRSRSPRCSRRSRPSTRCRAPTRATARSRRAIEARLARVRAELYASLTPWQRVLVARHPEPPGPRGLPRAAVSPASSRSTATGASPTTTRS